MTTFVFTGPATVDGQRVIRRTLTEMAEAAGHRVVSMVSGATDFVVASNNNFLARKGRKLRKADELGIPVIAPQTFVKMCVIEEDQGTRWLP